MAKVSAEIIEGLGTGRMCWVESVFTADKVYCFYGARDIETVREHSRIGGFPYDKISEVRFVLAQRCLGKAEDEA